jgi:hypothetical protein
MDHKKRSSNANSNADAPDWTGANHLEHIGADHLERRTASDGSSMTRPIFNP